MVVKEVLKRMRIAFGVSSLKEMCRKLKISDTTVSSWRKRQNIPEKHILKCSQITGFDYEWLLLGKEIDANLSKNNIVGDSNIMVDGNHNVVANDSKNINYNNDIKEICDLLLK